MPAWICVTCGVQFSDSPMTPARCPICEDERQYVGWEGQKWTTMAELATSHHSEVKREEAQLVGIGTSPSFAIGQRALLVCTPAGNVLWDCVSLLDDTARREVHALGGISCICLSHPHFYASCAEWADEFDARILLPAVDRDWVMRPTSRIEFFDENDVSPVPGVTLARIGGHFPGAAVLHWPAGGNGKGALLTGDTITVVPDRDWVSFMWSYPNIIPLDPQTIQNIVTRVQRFEFDTIYGGWWGRVVATEGAEAVRRSAQRYLSYLSAQP